MTQDHNRANQIRSPVTKSHFMKERGILIPLLQPPDPKLLFPALVLDDEPKMLKYVENGP